MADPDREMDASKIAAKHSELVGRGLSDESVLETYTPHLKRVSEDALVLNMPTSFLQLLQKTRRKFVVGDRSATALQSEDPASYVSAEN